MYRLAHRKSFVMHESIPAEPGSVEKGRESDFVKPLRKICTLVVAYAIVSPCWASLVFFRTIPPEGTWAEWQIKSDQASPDNVAKIRLTAGKVIEREQRRYQILELAGVFEAGEKPFKLKASYEVGLDGLKEKGYPSGDAHILTAYKETDGEMQAIKAGDPMLALYEVMFCMLSDVRIDSQTVRLSDPEGLRKCEFKLLKAKVNTKHAGSGQAPTSNFEAWTSDEVPFGVAKWVMKTKLPMDRIGEHIVVVQTATLIDSGDAASATTKPSDKTPPTTSTASSGESSPRSSGSTAR
jgi:hypothetical protein